MVTLERETFLQGYRWAFAFGAGPCMLCKSCFEDRCKHPDQARPSIEALALSSHLSLPKRIERSHEFDPGGGTSSTSRMVHHWLHR